MKWNIIISDVGNGFAACKIIKVSGSRLGQGNKEREGFWPYLLLNWQTVYGIFEVWHLLAVVR